MNKSIENLDLFLKEEGFFKSNINKVNFRNLTPLTLAIESKPANKYVDMLLKIGANPVLPNAIGCTPLQIAKKNPEMLTKIQQAIKYHSCKEVNAVEGALFLHHGELYKITRIIKGGSNSIKSIEIMDIKNGDFFILKIKHNFNGLEIRNYITLNKYVDLFPINKFILNNFIYYDVHALKQHVVPGLKLSLALKAQKDQASKDLIIYQAIVALCRLHKRGLVHRDALPDNCHWDEVKQRAEFFDYDVMRNYYDLGAHNFSKAMLNDFRRLFFGCITRSNSQIHGLSHYTPNLGLILQKIPDSLLSTKNKYKLLSGLEKRQNLSVNVTTKKLRVS